MFYEYLTIGIALIGSLYASYTDLKEGKIYNLCTFSLIYGGIIAQFMFFWNGWTSFTSMIAIILVGGGLSFLVYWLGSLAPGDAKLLWGVSMILPPTLFQPMARIRFPPVVVLMNTLFVYFWFSLFYILLKSSKTQKKQAFQSVFSPEKLPSKIVQYIVNLLSFLAFATCVYFVISNLLSIRLGRLLQLALVIFLFYALNKLIKRYFPERRFAVYVVVFPPFLLLALFASGAFWNIVKSSFIVVLVYVCVNLILKGFILSLDSIALSRPVSIFDLEAGMIPAESIIKKEEGEQLSFQKDASFSAHLDKNVIFSPIPEGISKDKIEELKKLADEGHFESFENKVMIQHSFNFAPFIFVGLILTLFAKGPFYLLYFKFFL